MFYLKLFQSSSSIAVFLVPYQALCSLISSGSCWKQREKECLWSGAQDFGYHTGQFSQNISLYTSSRLIYLLNLLDIWSTEHTITLPLLPNPFYTICQFNNNFLKKSWWHYLNQCDSCKELHFRRGICRQRLTLRVSHWREWDRVQW